MKGDIRKARKRTDIVEVLKLNLAGLQVTTRTSIPDGVMVVSPKEGERLMKMVEEANAKKAQELNETEEEGK